MKRRNRNEISSEDDEFIKNNYKSMNDNELAESLSLFKTTVHRRRLKLGLHRPGGSHSAKEPYGELNDYQKDFIVKNYESLSDNKIAKQLNITQYQVYSYRAVNNLIKVSIDKEVKTHYNDFEVIGEPYRSKSGSLYVECRCKCGNIRRLPIFRLENNKATCCGECGYIKRREEKRNNRKHNKDNKVCKRCNIEKPVTSFYKSNFSDGYACNCIECVLVLCKLAKYKITEEDLSVLQSRCDGKCEICGIQTEKLKLDHDHATNKIRGYLCNRCNTSIGQFEDNVDLLNNSIKYLYNYSPTINKIWGSYTILTKEKSFLVKHLSILAKQSISYQFHNFRDESWVIVKGNGIMRIDGILYKYEAGDYFEIKRKMAHQCIAETDTEVIETQLGDKIEESDIVRLEDNYGRI